MAALFPEADARARKNVTAILQGLATIGQSEVATELKVSESTISRMKDKDVPEMARFMALCGLKVIPDKFKCVDPAYLAGLEHFSRCWLEHVTAQGGEAKAPLTWD